MPPCLTLGIIRQGSRVKWSNPGKEVAPSTLPQYCSYWKGNLQATLDLGRQIYFYFKLKVKLSFDCILAVLFGVSGWRSQNKLISDILVAERILHFCLAHNLIQPLGSMHNFTQSGWLILFNPNHLSGQHKLGKPSNTLFGWTIRSVQTSYCLLFNSSSGSSFDTMREAV